MTVFEFQMTPYVVVTPRLKTLTYNLHTTLFLWRKVEASSSLLPFLNWTQFWSKITAYAERNLLNVWFTGGSVIPECQRKAHHSLDSGRKKKLA